MKKKIILVKNWIASRLPTRRRLIQLYSALLFNANLKGFSNGWIYQGAVKNLCAPGLNCYSCPGASAACPLGALQNALSASEKRTPYYVIGILMLYGLMFGRWICGFLCPFGLIQELLHKIKTPKLRKGKITRILSYFKYVILAVFVIILPLMYAFREFPLPGFCKYICPAGTLEGAIGLLSNKLNENLLAMLGPLFTWKFVLLVAFIVGSVFVYRFFCRFFCPLGAIYGFFNRIALIGVKVDAPKCTDCGICIDKCKMDIMRVGDHECINCGECISVCPTKAITWRGSKVFIADNVSGTAVASEKADDAVREEATSKAPCSRATLKPWVKPVAGVLSVLMLGSALVYYNFIDKAPAPSAPPQEEEEEELTYGNSVGNLCYGEELLIIGGENGETFNPAENRGKVTVINFWYTTCGPCIAELPHFSEIASEYADSVTVLAVHTNTGAEDAPAFIAKNYPETKMIFATDLVNEGYYQRLGGKAAYPMTVVLDGNGVIVANKSGSVSESELRAYIAAALEGAAS